MYACIYVYMYVLMHACIYGCMYVYVCMYNCTYMHVCINVCYMYVCTCMYCVCTYICMHVWMCVCMYLFMYVCIYASMYVFMWVCIYACRYVHVRYRPCWCPSPFSSPSISQCYSIHSSPAIGFHSCFSFTADVSAPILSILSLLTHFLGEFPGLGLALEPDVVVPAAEQGCMCMEQKSRSKFLPWPG